MDTKNLKQFGFFFDQSACIGCRTCQMSCKDYKQGDVGINFRRVVEYEGGTWVNDDGSENLVPKGVFVYYTSISCNHCKDPACIKACPTGAMHKTKYGIVDVNPKKCIGCKSCALACPYGAPQYDSRKKRMTKCNGCLERIEEGLKPICVESCPFRALDAGDIDELRAKHGTIAGVAPLPDARITQPNIVIKPSENSKGVNDKSGVAHLPNHYQEVKKDVV